MSVVLRAAIYCSHYLLAIVTRVGEEQVAIIISRAFEELNVSIGSICQENCCAMRLSIFGRIENRCQDDKRENT